MRTGEKKDHKNLHITFIINVSSSAELGNLGLDPSHFSFVPSSAGKGRKVNVDTTVLALVEFRICKVEWKMENVNSNLTHYPVDGRRAELE